MQLLHRHHWVEVARWFVSPKIGVTKYSGPPGAIEKIVHGYTVVELRCERCGDVCSRTLMGDATKRAES